MTIEILTTENGLPETGALVLVLIGGVGEVVSVGGSPGNLGSTGPDGKADVVLTSSDAGETQVRAVWDLNGDGIWDQATEPSTEPVCPVTWMAQPEPSPSPEPSPTPSPSPSPTPPPVVLDFSIQKTVDRAAADIGDTLNYVVTVSNTAGGTITKIPIVDPIPTGTTYVAGSASSGGAFDPAANTVSWTLPSLPAGQSATVSFGVIINPGAPTTITNFATACPNELPCKEARATTSLLSVLGERIPRAAPETLPVTGSDRVALLLFALSMVGAGFTISMRMEGKKSILR